MTSATELNATLPYATPDELAWLTAHARTLPPYARVVVIGAGPCIMPLALLEGNSTLFIRIIDVNEMHYCQAHIEAEYPGARVAYVRGKSSEMIIGEAIDFLLVDGSHEYGEVLADALVYLPHLKSDSLAFFHDYDARGTVFEVREWYAGVGRALEEYLRLNPAFRFERMVGTAAIVRRLA